MMKIIHVALFVAITAASLYVFLTYDFMENERRYPGEKVFLTKKEFYEPDNRHSKQN